MSVPAHSIDSSVKVPWMLLLPMVEVIVNMVLASATVGLPLTEQVAGSSVRPAGSAGTIWQLVNSSMMGCTETSP